MQAWAKTSGILEITEEERQMSNERLATCAVCPFVAESTMLKIIRSEVHNLDVIKCTRCGCPINEKTIIKNEKCPEGKW